jgi:hypothetical protein
MGKPNKTAKAKAEQQAIEESTLSFGDAAALLERCLVECGIELFSDRLKVAVPPHLQLEFKKGIVLFFFTDLISQPFKLMYIVSFQCIVGKCRST